MQSDSICMTFCCAFEHLRRYKASALLQRQKNFSFASTASDLFGRITFAMSRFSVCRSDSELSPVKSKHLKAMKQGKLSWGNPVRKLK